MHAVPIDKIVSPECSFLGVYILPDHTVCPDMTEYDYLYELQDESYMKLYSKICQPGRHHKLLLLSPGHALILAIPHTRLDLKLKIGLHNFMSQVSVLTFSIILWNTPILLWTR